MSADSNNPKPKSPDTENVATFHGSDEEDHVVGIGDLRVSVLEENGSWFAQGLEIDYLAVGETQEDAKRNFERGLTQTIQENLKIHGTFEKIIVPAPPKVWQEFLSPEVIKKRYSQVSIHTIKKNLQITLPELPFEAIRYAETVGLSGDSI